MFATAAIRRVEVRKLRRTDMPAGRANVRTEVSPIAMALHLQCQGGRRRECDQKVVAMSGHAAWQQWARMMHPRSLSSAHSGEQAMRNPYNNLRLLTVLTAFSATALAQNTLPPPSAPPGAQQYPELPVSPAGQTPVSPSQQPPSYPLYPPTGAGASSGASSGASGAPTDPSGASGASGSGGVSSSGGYQAPTEPAGEPSSMQFEARPGTAGAAESRPLPPAAPLAVLTPVTENDITYLCGGVGQEEAAHMKQAARDYDLMLTFAARDGSYLADVNVDIADSGGKSMLKTVCDAPIMLVDLPRSGTYRLKAETGGHT
jgi:hypothetical protein